MIDGSRQRFYVWVSVFNLFIASVFWSLMSDMYSRLQAKRLFGFIAAGGSAGAIGGPTITAFLAERIGNNGLLLCSAAGFAVAIALLILLGREKAHVASHEADEPTKLDHTLGGTPFDGFKFLAKSPYLILVAGFVILLTWVSTILYFQQAEMISAAFESREKRTTVFAAIDLIVNIGAVLIQLFGTGRIAQRFGVTTILMIGPLLMMLAFAAVAISPILIVLLSVQAVRRISEYAITRPGREMLFTVVGQESRYKSKNVIDTVVYRFGDLSSAWVIAGLQGIGIGAAGIGVFGLLVSGVWAWSGRHLGRRYENIRSR